MIGHLCGKTVPGIPINNPLPKDPVERAKQVHWQHTTMLTFLKFVYCLHVNFKLLQSNIKKFKKEK